LKLKKASGKCGHAVPCFRHVKKWRFSNSYPKNHFVCVYTSLKKVAVLNSVHFWIEFHLLIVTFLILDLGIFQRKIKKKPSFKRACLHSAFWIILALVFNAFIYYVSGYESALQFFTGYLIEKSLSIDNLFLFLFLFLHFDISAVHQHKILFWGILGALIFRMSLILAGVILIDRFHWLYYFLGAFLIFTGINFALQNPRKKKDPTKSLSYRFFKKIFPIEEKDFKEEFFIKKRGKWKITTLFIVLLLIETADIVFALDSIPAIFAITTDPFIVYTSNVFAILGLRSHYFVLASSLSKLYYYKVGLAAILVFVGSKMVLASYIPISVPMSLMVIVAIMGVTVVCSLMRVRFE
jgi:tellurite resistance protein TerC